MRFIAAQGGPKIPPDVRVSGKVGIGPRSERRFGIKVDPTIGLPGLPQAEAKALVEKAHEICPYSNATRGNVDVALHILQR